MTQAVATPPVSGWPEGSLYFSPTMYGFQVEHIARAYLRLEDSQGVMAVWDTGTGKSHLAMALAAMMFEDDAIDLVLLIAEKTKIAKDEWPADLERFTRLRTHVWHGTGREQRLKKFREQGDPQVIITTYETGKADLLKPVQKPGKRRGDVDYVPGPLMPLIKGKRVLLVMDESTKVKNRGTGLGKSWNKVVERMRSRTAAVIKEMGGASVKALMMTATPIEKDWEDAYNQLRLADPKQMPIIKEFDAWFVRGRDPWNRAQYKRDEMPKFAAMCAPMILRVRKTDPEVMAEFPKQVEEARWFDMAQDQRDLYELVCDLQEDSSEPVPGLHTIKRMIANHPASVIHSAKHGTSKIAKILLEELGEDYLRSVSSVKERRMLDWIAPVRDQGAKAIVFSFFGPSLLPLLGSQLRSKKHRVFMGHGGMSADEVASQRMAFKTYDGPAVYLSSDAGARGVNLPQATYVLEYESALTYAMRTQRINRAHRIDSEAESVMCMTFFARETVEQTIAEAMIRRNEQADILLGDDDAGEDFITALERKRALQIRRGAVRQKR